MKKLNQCHKCGKCCRWIFIRQNDTHSKDIKDLMAAKGNKILSNKWIAVYNPCQFLDLKTNKCLKY